MWCKPNRGDCWGGVMSDRQEGWCSADGRLAGTLGGAEPGGLLGAQGGGQSPPHGERQRGRRGERMRVGRLSSGLTRGGGKPAASL